MSRLPPGSPPRVGRITNYCGTMMRSRLEASAARIFDEQGITWLYEPLAFANASGQYLPDFEILLAFKGQTDRHAHTYVEVKPAVARTPNEMVGIRRRLEIIWASDPGASLMVMFPEDRRVEIQYPPCGDPECRPHPTRYEHGKWNTLVIPA